MKGEYDMSMFGFFDMIGNYEDRKTARDLVDGLIVSTCYTTDEGYETAIIDLNKTYPVQRYETEEQALEGHADWVKQAETLERVDRLGWLGMDELAETFELERGLTEL